MGTRDASLVDWLRTQQRGLVHAALMGLSTQSEPERHREAQLRWICDYNVTLFLRMLDGSVIDEESAADLVASAARRASEGSPIEALLQDYVSGMSAIWQAAAANVTADHHDDLIELTQAIHAYMRIVVGLVARGFQREQERITSGARDARFAAYSALLSGSAPHDAARRAGLTLAPRYLALSLRLGPPDVGDAGLGRTRQVEEHRRANTVQRILSQQADGTVLTLVSGPEGTALVPLPIVPEVDEAEQIRRWVTDLSRALGCSVHAGAAIARPEDVPGAVAQAEEILELVLATGRSEGAWLLDDVVVTYQLTRPGPARDQLATRLRPLADRPEWVETLRAYVAHDFDRRQTATHLHVHPNTVDYRLARLTDLCGLDATDLTQRMTVVAALAVLDVEEYRGL